MLKFSAVSYFLLARHLELWAGKYVTIPDAQVEPEYINTLNGFRQSCVNLGLRLSAKHIDERMLEKFKHQSVPTSAEFRELVDALIARIEDELDLTLFLYVPNTRAEFYEQKEPLFGITVADQFSSAITDIEEAGKCLALGRGTASVFHLMRVMEVGLKALAKGLKIPYAPSWESFLRQIETKLGEKHSKKSRGWKKAEPFYRDAAGDLQMVKIAWRNPTMHIVKAYTPEEAEDVFRAVRTFMQRLATKFDQRGLLNEKQ